MKIKSAGVFHSLRPFQAGTLVFACFFFCAALNLAAQELDRSSVESARIYYAEGVDFSVSMNGERTVFPAASAGKEGIYLERSALVNTGAGSFAEIQLIPSGTVIKLSENTSLAYNGFDEAGKFTDFGLLYGRIRVVAGASSFVIRSGGISARCGEGDFGIDYVLEPGSQNSVPRPLFRLFAFRGGAELRPHGRGGNPADFGGVETLAVAEGETLSLDISSSYAFAERKPLGRDIVDYWRRHNFAGNPPLAMPDTSLADILPPFHWQQDLVISDEGPLRRVYSGQSPAAETMPLIPAEPEGKSAGSGLIKAKNSMLYLGLGLIVISTGVQGGAYYQFNESSNEIPRKIFSIAYIPLGFGVISTLLGIFLNPSGY